MSKGNMLNGAQVIVDYLIQEKVPQVFGLCGHGNIQFIDALYERSADIKTISVHHESVAGFMADVYYRVSGQPTATFTSCGPGSANLPISLGNAFLDSVPFMAVTGNVPTSQFNRGAFQELYRHYQADFPSTVRSYCKKVFQPTRGEMVPLAVRQAWKTMVTGRPGPVVLDVPFDVFLEAAAEEAPRAADWSATISSRCGADPDGVIKAVDMLLGAERPVMIVGQGVRYGGACVELLRLAERLQIPVASSASGLGAIDCHPAGRRAAGTRRAFRRPYLEFVDPGLFLHHPADAAHSRRHRSRGDRPQLSGGARPDGRRAHLPASDSY
jgi:acetolactate synthase-1/2/3 large subunit